jgi:hypothetical protein
MGSPSRVTALEHTAIGAVGGVMEVMCMQPMVAFKNALQEGRPMPRTVTQMYRGLLVRACCSCTSPQHTQHHQSR